MKKIALYLLMISFCLANDNFSSSLKDINKAIQKKYNINSLEDLQKLINQNQQSSSTSTRDVEDIPGNYSLGEQSVDIEVTVGTDQTLFNPLSLMGMLPATSSVTADIADGDAVTTTELHYMLLSDYLEDMFGGGDGDCDMNCQGEFDDYNDYGIDVSDEYCECCQDEYPLDEVCYSDDVEWIYFEKEDYADYTDSENWDIINDDVAIMRRDNQGFYNPLQEDSYANGGPAGTLWAGMSTHRAMDEGVSYTTWNQAVNSNPQSFIGDTLSVYCEAAYEYYDIHLLSFSGQQTGGGFSYYRTAYPVHGDEENRDDHYEGTVDFENVANMNYPRYGAAYTEDGNFIYALCGADSDQEGNTVYHTHGERYDHNNDSWETFGENLIGRRYTNAEHVNGNIYILNGYHNNGGTDIVEIINTSTGEVSVSETNPHPVWYGGSAVWDNKIYTFGGGYYDGDDLQYSSRLYVFDPEDEQWTRLADMPDSMNTNGVVVDGVLYTFGGYNGSVSDDINAYHIGDDVWETVGSLPNPISANSVSTNGDLIFVVGDYANIEFTGAYSPWENEFYELESNMEGRRHSSAVNFDGELWAYGGSQPAGYNDNEDYVILSSAQRGIFNITPHDDHDDDGDDFQPELLMMNFTMMEYMMLMFGADPDSLGIENPVVMGLTTNDDGTLAEVRAMLPMGDHEDGGVELYALDSTAMVNAVGIDTALYAITFDNLSLEDSSGYYGLNVTGAIAPQTTHLVAGVATSISLPMDMFGDDEGNTEEGYVSFYSDFTARDIFIGYEDGEVSEIDTNYFNWDANSTSLWLMMEESDDYYYGYDSTYIDTQSFVYTITDTGIQLSGSYDPCEDEESYDDCIDEDDDYFQMLGLDQLEDITNLVETMMLFLNQEDNAEPCVLGTVYVSEGHTSGDPEDYIEIYNSGDNECSLEGFQLDDNDELDDLTFGYIAIPAGGYWVGYKDDPGSFESGLSANGDIIVLADAQNNMLTVTLEPSVEMDDVELSQSFDEDGVGCYTFPTPGESNDDCITLSISDPELSALPKEFKLYANFPNPFNPKTTIRFDVAESTSGITTLKIYDITGSVVAVLINEQFQPGTYDLQWDAGQFASGVYFSELISGSFRQTKKMILLK